MEVILTIISLIRKIWLVKFCKSSIKWFLTMTLTVFTVVDGVDSWLDFEVFFNFFLPENNDVLSLWLKIQWKLQNHFVMLKYEDDSETRKEEKMVEVNVTYIERMEMPCITPICGTRNKPIDQWNFRCFTQMLLKRKKYRVHDYTV